LKILCFLFAAAADRRRHFADAAAVAGKNTRRAAADSFRPAQTTLFLYLLFTNKVA